VRPDPERDRLVESITVTPPFARLARTHAVLAGGDAAVALALAGSLFFDISPEAARGKVAAYLLFSLAPFAVIAPLIGPAIDRMPGGRRLVVVVIALLRALLCVLMAMHIDSLLVFPEAFLMLVLQKSYGVSKSALVPTVVDSPDELVEANSKLGLLSGIVGFVAIVPAMLFQLFSPSLTLLYAGALFLVAFVLAIQLPKSVVARSSAEALEKSELHKPGVMLAASAMVLTRAAVGFLVFQTAFWFRREGSSTLWFGVVIAGSALGTMAGNALAGPLRARVREERMLVGALVVPTVAGVVLAFAPSPITAALLALALGLGASVARAAFDSIVQRDAPDANQGRAFAQFETRFQLAWVAAGAIPVLVPLPGAVGFLVVAGLCGTAIVSYLVWSRRVKGGVAPPDPLTSRLWRGLRRVMRRNDALSAGRPPRPSPFEDGS
jgi:MFS family permease